MVAAGDNEQAGGSVPAGRSAGATMPASFGQRLAERVATRESQVVIGLDPDPRRLWPQAWSAQAGGRVAGSGDPATPAAAAVAAHCCAVIDAAGPAAVAVKPQLACFERLGAPGWAALARVCAHARAAGLLVLADAKRGDIDVSAAAYGQAFLTGTPTPAGDVEGLGADALTANPYLGADTLAPLLAAARERGAGIFVLVRTSNPGAGDLQDLPLAAGGTVWEHVAGLVATLGEQGAQRPEAAGRLADVGAVVGATAPQHLERMRELMPRAVFLLPGVGAQGGRVEDLAPAFAPGRAAGLVTASRSIVAAHQSAGGEPATSARAEAERLRATAWGLGAP
jgi:orotidine-5'-phosphate decarboxylase